MRPTTLRLSLAMTLLLPRCSSPCDDWDTFIEDPRVEKADNGIVIGREGTIYQIWELNPVLVDSLSREDLLDVVEFYGSALVVGRNGTIRKSQDAGYTWSIPTAPPVTVDLFSVHTGCSDLLLHLPKRPGMIVGDGGTVLRTRDSGDSWEKVDLGLDVALRAVAVLSENEALVAGQAGVIYRTDTFGDTWLSTPSVTNDEIVVLLEFQAYCLEPDPDPNLADYAFAATRNGDILISDDRGRTWRVFDHFPHGTVTDLFVGETLDPTILSGNALWGRANSEWRPNVKAPEPITYYSSVLIIAGGVVYKPYVGSTCL